MKTKLTLCAIIALALFVSSCNIQKRLYRDGFYVAGNHKKSNPKEDRAVSSGLNSEQTAPLVNEAEADNIFEAAPSPILPPTAQPIVNNEEARSSEAAGSSSIIDPHSPVVKRQDPLHVKKEKSKHEAAPQPGGDKSLLVALLLCIFLGVIGAHRYYLGYIGIGVLMTLTIGCLLVLWFIDLIRLISGSLEPKNGSYTDV